MTTAYYNCIFKNKEYKTYTYISYKLKVPNQFNVPSKLKLIKYIKKHINNLELVYITESTQSPKNYAITNLAT